MRFRRLRLRAVRAGIAGVMLLLAAGLSEGGTWIGVGDEVYDTLERLDALGAIPGGLLATKPLSRREIVRLARQAEQNASGKGPLAEALARRLTEDFPPEDADVMFFKPVERVYASYVRNDSDSQALVYNNDGDRYLEGSNVRAGFAARAELGWIGGFVNPEYRRTAGEDHLVGREAYIAVGTPAAELTVGRVSQWWGPGAHGALLLSNNAEPPVTARLTNPEPLLLPWFLRSLGPFRYTAFVSRLDKERDFPEPYLWGLRVDFRPHPALELGASRTAMLGGEGRPEDLSTWWDSLTGRGENDPDTSAGDQRMAYDLRLLLPNRHQPLALYAEVGGEDVDDFWPVKRAWLVGIYLPRLLSLERIDLRAEYATNHSYIPNVWYNHVTYTSGYTFKGRIIGHQMGSDSKDLFLQTSVDIADGRGNVSLHYDREEHNLSAAVREKKDEAGVALDLLLDRKASVRAFYAYGRIRNPGGIPSGTENVNLIVGAFTYLF